MKPRSGAVPGLVRSRVAAVLVLAAVLAACGNTASAGDAAVIGSARITTDDLAATVAEVQEALGTTPGAPDEGLVVDILQREIITELVAQSAQREGISLTQGQIDAKRAETAAGVGGEGIIRPAGSGRRCVRVCGWVGVLGGGVVGHVGVCM